MQNVTYAGLSGAVLMLASEGGVDRLCRSEWRGFSKVAVFSAEKAAFCAVKQAVIMIVPAFAGLCGLQYLHRQIPHFSNSTDLPMPSKKRLTFSFFASLFCACVMLFEDIGEAMGVAWIDEWDDIHVWEVLIMLSLFGAIMILGNEVLKMSRYQETLEDKVARASGAFEDLLNAYFEEWSFSDAEREVTRLLIKGCSTAEMAEIRNAKEGTIKAQTNAIYKKSGYGGKTQLLRRVAGRPDRWRICRLMFWTLSRILRL